MSIAVVIASLARSQALADCLAELANQSKVPDRIVLSLTGPADEPPGWASYSNVEVIHAPIGSCAQRSVALDHLGGGHDVILFLDDDYLPSRFAVERAAQLMADHTDLAGATGHLLADGIDGPGIQLEEAKRTLCDYDRKKAPPIRPYRDLVGLYGCNMVFRGEAIDGLRFDERLPLYGWQEDIDFSAQAAKRGRIVKTFAFAGVHCGIKRGRSSGVRLGYSQMVNPVYLVRKGTMQPSYARNIMIRNIAANHLRALRPERWVDRIGRVRGNWLGLIDLALGRVRPERILKL